MTGGGTAAGGADEELPLPRAVEPEQRTATGSLETAGPAAKPPELAPIQPARGTGR
jgi:hypothetical protein